jgi:hypothetical protein
MGNIARVPLRQDQIGDLGIVVKTRATSGQISLHWDRV